MEIEARFSVVQRFWMAVFVAVTLGLMVGGYWYYRHEAQAIRKTKYNELKAIAGLKAGQIVAWRRERMNDARLHSSGSFIARSVALWLRDQGNAALKAD